MVPPRLSPKTLSALQERAFQSTIVTLDLDGCRTLTDDVACDLINKCTHLTEARFGSCTKLVALENLNSSSLQVRLESLLSPSVVRL